MPVPKTTLIKDEENAGRNAFQHDVQFINAARGSVQSFLAPAGKNLVVEFVTANFTLDSPQVVPVMFIAASVGGSSISHLIVLDKLDPNNWGASLVVRLYADAATSVNVQVSSINGGTFNGHVTVVGHLVSVT